MHAKIEARAEEVVSEPATTARTPSSTSCESGGGGVSLSSWFYEKLDVSMQIQASVRQTHEIVKEVAAARALSYPYPYQCLTLDDKSLYWGD